MYMWWTMICMQSRDLNADYHRCVQVNKSSHSREKKSLYKSQQFLDATWGLSYPIHLTMPCDNNTYIASISKYLNWHHTDVTSLPKLFEIVFSLQTNKRFYLHSSHIHSPLTVIAVDFMGLFHYKGNKTAGYIEMQHGNHYSTARETIILTLSDFLSLTGCETFMLRTKPATAFKTWTSQVNDNDNLVTIS